MHVTPGAKTINKQQLNEEQLRAVQRHEAFLYLKIEQYKSRQ